MDVFVYFFPTGDSDHPLHPGTRGRGRGRGKGGEMCHAHWYQVIQEGVAKGE